MLLIIRVLDAPIKWAYSKITRNNKITVSGRLDTIETSIQNLLSIVTENEELLFNVSQGTLENMLFNDEIAIFRRLKAYRRLIGLKTNGRVKKMGFKLILDNKDTWLDVMDTKMNIRIIDQAFYDNTLNEIDKRIYGGII